MPTDDTIEFVVKDLLFVHVGLKIETVPLDEA